MKNGLHENRQREGRVLKLAVPTNRECTDGLVAGILAHYAGGLLSWRSPRAGALLEEPLNR